MLRFDRSAHDAVVAAAREGAPREVCGVLAGEYGDEESRVAAAHPTANVADAPRTRYELDPEEQLRVIEGIEDRGRDVVGFYHSHPSGPAAPSGTDVANATWSGYSYVICALVGEPVVRSWRWDREAGSFEREVVEVVDADDE